MKTLWFSYHVFLRLIPKRLFKKQKTLDTVWFSFSCSGFLSLSYSVENSSIPSSYMSLYYHKNKQSGKLITLILYKNSGGGHAWTWPLLYIRTPPLKNLLNGLEIMVLVELDSSINIHLHKHPPTHIHIQIYICTHTHEYILEQYVTVHSNIIYGNI